MSTVVLARALEHRYRAGRLGLRPTNLRIQAGEVVVALGPNGSGKSTLLRLLATDLRADPERLELLGRPAKRPLRQHRRRIGYAPDNPVHVPWLTGAENARLFLELAGEDDPETLERADELFRTMGLDDVRDVPASEYSFGMGRKLLLIEVLAPPYPLVLLDEPSVGLDPEGVSGLVSALRSRASEGTAVVMATNETRTLPLSADRVLFLHEGAVVEDAPLGALLARLEGNTRIEIWFAERVPRRPERFEGESPVPGVRQVEWNDTVARLESEAGSGPLPELLRILLAAGVRVQGVRVREPGLGDLFRSMTGSELGNE